MRTPVQAIRPAAPEDLEAVARIYARSIATADWLPPADRAETDFGKVSEGEDVSVCFDRTRELVGFISVWREDSFIHHLHVVANARRQGVGTALIQSLGTWLPRPWSLKCVLLNGTARRFYRARGFIEVSINTDERAPYVLMQGPID